MFLSPLQVVSHLSVLPGMRVGDFGSGNGQHSLLLSERLDGEGAVYAFELNEEGVEALAREQVRSNIDNLFSMCVDLNSHLPLRDAMLHCALVSNTLHAVQDKERFMGELGRVLVDKGEVLFVDWTCSFKNMGPCDDDVVIPGDAVKLFEKHGFSVGDMLPAGSHHYAFVATKI